MYKRQVWKDGITKESRRNEKLVAAGVLRAGSVGFLGEEVLLDANDDEAWGTWGYEGRIAFPKMELLEYSIVGIPADPTALRMAYGWKRPERKKQQAEESLDAILLSGIDEWLKGEIDG